LHNTFLRQRVSWASHFAAASSASLTVIDFATGWLIGQDTTTRRYADFFGFTAVATASRRVSGFEGWPLASVISSSASASPLAVFASFQIRLRSYFEGQ